LRVIKRSLKRAAAYFAVAAAVATASAQTASAQTATPPGATQPTAGADPALIDQGKATYAEKCSHCHGPGMMNAGTITPDLRKFPDDRPRFFTTVKSGKNGRMPPWGDLLNDDQIGALWAYVSNQRKP
jgi:mono/diheme cytochrome c family protein